MFLKQLEYFVHVAELGSFTRAANVLDIGQPALSRQIRQLEVEFRQNLLMRNGRGVRTTEAGQLLLEYGRGILHQVKRMREEMSRVNGALAGRVSIGLPPTIAGRITVTLMREFGKRLPHASLAVSEGMTPAIIDGLHSGQLDVALLYNPTLSEDIETIPLMEEPLVLVGSRNTGSPSSPVTLHQLARLPLVMPGRVHTMRRLLEAEMADISLKPRIVCEVDGIPAILALVADGAGYSVMPERAVKNVSTAKAFSLRPIVKPSIISRLTIATSAKRKSTLTQQALITLLQDVVSSLPEFSALISNPTGSAESFLAVAEQER